MKHLGLVPIILLIGMGLFYGPVAAELTAYQQVPSQATVGETVMVTVMLTYNGVNSTQALITPTLPTGVVTDSGVQTAELYPGALQPISYPIRPEQSGMYWIVSQIAYAEDGSWHNLRLEAPFDAISGAPLEPQPMPGEQIPGGRLPGDADPNTVPPGGRLPGDADPGTVPPGGIMPRGATPDGGAQGNATDNGDSSGGLPYQDPDRGFPSSPSEQ
jgi:hypothetical protein